MSIRLSSSEAIECAIAIVRTSGLQLDDVMVADLQGAAKNNQLDRFVRRVVVRARACARGWEDPFRVQRSQTPLSAKGLLYSADAIEHLRLPSK
jgi:hypothetical protein